MKSQPRKFAMDCWRKRESGKRRGIVKGWVGLRDVDVDE